ncbi:aminotransferase class III-fold pyridoxal phosphate-dependent enzyme [Corynebacterium sp. 335C]
MPAPTSPAARATYDHDAAHVFRPWSKQTGLAPMVVEAAKGTVVTDSEGRDDLDFGSQLVYVNVGHGHPRVAEAIEQEAGRLATIQPSMAVASRSEAARLVAKHLPEGMNKVFFTNGGADAVEHAIRMARLHTGRYKVLSAYRGYHGATQQAMTTSGDPRRFANDYGVGGNVHFFGPFLYRPPTRRRRRRRNASARSPSSSTPATTTCSCAGTASRCAASGRRPSTPWSATSRGS